MNRLFSYYLKRFFPTILLNFLLAGMISTAADSVAIFTGSELSYKPFEMPSIDYSNYLCGKITKETKSSIDQIKIIRKSIKNGSIDLCVVPIDRFGNYIEGLTAKEFAPEAILSYNFERIPASLVFLSESKWNLSKEFLNIHFLVESSYATENIREIIAQLRGSLQSIQTGDAVSVSLQNHLIYQPYPLESAEAVMVKLNSDNIFAAGPNASADALKSLLEDIMENKSDSKDIIILIASSGENASLFCEYDEIVKKSLELEIPIYSIGIGSDIRSYQLSPVSDATGGKFYWLNEVGLKNLRLVLDEIYFANKVHYKVRITPAAPLPNYDDLDIKLSYYNGKKFVDDSTCVFLKPPQIFTTNKILSLFGTNEAEMDADYLSRINNLAELMQSNTKLRVRIIGHTENEGKDNLSDKALSFERATRAKEAIVAKGVNPHRIETRGSGNTNPLYYAPRNSSQSAMNRRSELRFLVEEDLPYEVLGEIAESEFEADKMIAKWEEFGYRAYYKRIFEFGEVKYKIVLWGFESESKASKEMEKLKSTFENIEFQVD